MSGIQQMLTGGTYNPAPPTTIGQAYGGGFYAGQIAVGGGGVATHYLIVAPKASGESAGKVWGPETRTDISSVINGPTNSAALAALGSSYQAATFCEDLTIGGYSDWYLPAYNELEVLYYFLKPTTNANSTSSGSNANAVSPEPINTVYTSGSPAQTSATAFQTGNSEAIALAYYWSSSESTVSGNQTRYAFGRNMNTGYESDLNKVSSYYVRAVRRVPI